MTRNKNASGKGKGQGKGASSASAMAHTRSQGPPPSEAEEVESEASGSRQNDDSIYYVTRSESIGTDTIPSHSNKSSQHMPGPPRNLEAEINPGSQHQSEGGTGAVAQPGEEILVGGVGPELVTDHEAINQDDSDNLDGQTDKHSGSNGTIASLGAKENLWAVTVLQIFVEKYHSFVRRCSGFHPHSGLGQEMSFMHVLLSLKRGCKRTLSLMWMN